MKKIKLFLISVLGILVLGLIAGCVQVSKPGDDSHEHALTFIAAKAATCMEEGNTAYFKCTECGKTFSDIDGADEYTDYIIEKTEHTISDSTIIKQPTWDEEGVLSEQCSVCNQTFEQALEKLTISQLKVTSAPSKTEYVEGEQFDCTGMVISAVLNNGSEQTVTDYEVSKTVLSIGDTYVTVSWRGKKVNVPVTVTATQKATLESLEVATPPTKTEYTDGEEFDRSGMVIKAVYSDNSKQTITDYNIDKTTLSASDTFVTVSWNGKTINVSVTVAPNIAIERLELTTPPTKTEYLEGEEFDRSGMVIKAVYSDSSSETITDYSIDKTVLTKGDNFVTVSWKGKTVNVDVTVIGVTNVSELFSAELGSEYLVRGIYVGVSEEGPSGDYELLLKDIDADNIIAVRNVSYGTFPDYGYSYGDELLIKATLKKDTTVNTPNKKYLDFSESNGLINESIIGRSEVSYNFNDVYEISNFAHMQDFFTISNVKDYAYVKFSGTVYFNSYTGSDNILIYRVHTNGSATAVAGIKPDGTRTVSLRSNIMTKNLGANWDNFLDTTSSYQTFPGIPFTGTFTAVYTGANNYYFQLTILEADFIDSNTEIPDKPEPFTNAEAVSEIAYAFYRRGTQIQYDQTESRRNLNPSPEESNSDKTLYLDCSSYVNACFFEAFGQNVMPYTVSAKLPNTANFTTYAKDNPSKSDVIGYWENANYTTTTAQKNILQQVKALLQQGDVLVYRHGASSGTSGHVYIYVGNNTFLHCTGSSYDYQSDPLNSTDKATTIEKNQGAIQQIDTYSIFEDTSNTRYLFKKTSTDSIYNFSLLRPLAREMTPTENTQKRMSLRGIEIYKNDTGHLYSATKGTVTFELKIKNNSSAAYGKLVVEETIAEGLTYSSNSSGAGTVTTTNKKVTWTIPSLAAGKTETITISFRVANNFNENTLTSKNTTTINSFVVKNTIIRTISNMATEKENALIAKAEEYIKSSKTFTNPVAMVSTLYSEACNIDLFEYTTVSTALTDIINSSTNTYRTDTQVSQMLVPCLYGGLDIKSGYLKDNERVRMLKERYLSVGDIIIAEYSSSSVAYVYLGNSKLLAVYSGTKTAQSVSITTNEYTNILVTLISYDRYAVLRPSLVN